MDPVETLVNRRSQLQKNYFFYSKFTYVDNIK